MRFLLACAAMRLAYLLPIVLALPLAVPNTLATTHREHTHTHTHIHTVTVTETHTPGQAHPTEYAEAGATRAPRWMEDPDEPSAQHHRKVKMMRRGEALREGTEGAVADVTVFSAGSVSVSKRFSPGVVVRRHLLGEKVAEKRAEQGVQDRVKVHVEVALGIQSVVPLWHHCAPDPVRDLVLGSHTCGHEQRVSVLQRHRSALDVGLLPCRRCKT